MEKIHVGPTCTIYRGSEEKWKELRNLVPGSFFLYKNQLYRKVRVEGEKCNRNAYMNSYGRVGDYFQDDLLVIPVKVEMKTTRKKYE